MTWPGVPDHFGRRGRIRWWAAVRADAALRALLHRYGAAPEALRSLDQLADVLRGLVLKAEAEAECQAEAADAATRRGGA